MSLSHRIDYFLVALEAFPCRARARFLRAALRVLEQKIPAVALIYQVTI
jgi:hypothetical protein